MTIAHAFTETAMEANEVLSTDIHLVVETDMSVLETEWRALQREETSYIYQDYDWVRLAFETFEAKNERLILHGRVGQDANFIIPLVVEGSLIKYARWPGANHANICCGLYSKKLIRLCDKTMLNRILSELKRLRPDIGYLQLQSQPPTLRGHPNPMRFLPHQASTNIMFDLDLTPGMNAVLDQGNGKRKRKLFRKQVREAGKLGGYELVSPRTPEEIKASLADFFEQKAERFSELGVNDVFAPSEAKAFMSALAHEPAHDDNTLLRLFELKVGDKTRAMYGCSLLGTYCQAWVNSVTYDDFSTHSPGEMVLYLMVEQLIEEGFTLFDLGVGTERYKLSWCKSNTQMLDVIMPLSIAAIPYVMGLKLKTAIKTRLRNHEPVWKHLKKIRKFKAAIFG